MDAPYAFTHAQSTASDLRTTKNTSKAPKSPERSTEMRTVIESMQKQLQKQQNQSLHPQNRPKTPNSPIGAKGQHIDEADGLGNIADGLIECRDM